MTTRLTCTLLLLISLRFSAVAQVKTDLQYQLKYSGNNSVHVTMIYTPAENDSSSFIYGEPMFGGQPDIINCIANVRVSPLPGFGQILLPEPLPCFFPAKNR